MKNRTLELVLARHAEAERAFGAMADHERPLTLRGESDIKTKAASLLAQNWIPECIIASTALRAKTTARRLAEGLGFKEEVHLFREIYDGEWVQKVLPLITQLRGPVVLVGHNPGISFHASFFAGTALHLETTQMVFLRTETPTTWEHALYEHGRWKLSNVL